MELSVKQYAAIGRTAVACSRIEYLIRYFAAHCVGSPEFDIANSAIDDRQPREAFEKVIRAVSLEYPALQTRVRAVKTILGEAKDLADKRNVLMHGIVEVDPKTRKPTIYARKGSLSCDQRELDDVAVEATDFYDRFCDVCGALFEDLAEARAKR